MKAGTITKGQIKDAINTIVNDHSGGVKYTELITDLVPFVINLQRKGKRGRPSKDLTAQVGAKLSPDKLLKIIEGMKELKILVYTFADLEREKVFIYTP